MFSGMPPTYESLYGEFRQVEDPRGLAQFLAKTFAVIISTSKSLRMLFCSLTLFEIRETEIQND